MYRVVGAHLRQPPPGLLRPARHRLQPRPVLLQRRRAPRSQPPFPSRGGTQLRAGFPSRRGTRFRAGFHSRRGTRPAPLCPSRPFARRDSPPRRRRRAPRCRPGCTSWSPAANGRGRAGSQSRVDPIGRFHSIRAGGTPTWCCCRRRRGRGASRAGAAAAINQSMHEAYNNDNSNIGGDVPDDDDTYRFDQSIGNQISQCNA